jgi:hypothetical protein
VAGEIDSEENKDRLWGRRKEIRKISNFRALSLLLETCRRVHNLLFVTAVHAGMVSKMDALTHLCFDLKSDVMFHLLLRILIVNHFNPVSQISVSQVWGDLDTYRVVICHIYKSTDFTPSCIPFLWGSSEVCIKAQYPLGHSCISITKSYRMGIPCWNG